ncbi:MAG: ATP-grasp domain-containing protein [Acidobacteriota bacterium]
MAEPLPPRHVLLAGISTRAMADSAARAGFAVTAIDAFGDLDQHAAVRSLSLRRDLDAPVSAAAAARAAHGIASDAVAYGSNFENHPSAVRSLAVGRSLWGNPPEVLRRVRDPRLVSETLAGRGVPGPAVRVRPVDDADPSSAFSRTRSASSASSISAFSASSSGSDRWLVKPLASGGGHRVRPWRPGTRIPHGCYLQELVDGMSGSVVFVAAGGRAVPLGISRQLAGEGAFGASGYRYCGNILPSAEDRVFPCDRALVDAAGTLASVVAAEFGLVGVNGIDFVARGASLYAIEVNPRWSASMELVERASGLSMFGAHAAACTAGTLPIFDLARERRRVRAIGKAVVFARRSVVTGDTRAWLADPDVRDVPHPGERIPAGRPVCTVFAEADDAAACRMALARRADAVYAELAGREDSMVRTR